MIMSIFGELRELYPFAPRTEPQTQAAEWNRRTDEVGISPDDARELVANINNREFSSAIPVHKVIRALAVLEHERQMRAAQ